MRLLGAIAAVGAAVVMTTGASAQAEETRAERTATAAEVPWYERFTLSSGQDQTPSWSSVNPRLPAGPATGRWDLTVKVGEADRANRIERITPQNQADIGAFFRFTPNVRVGGKVSVTDQPPPGAPAADKDEKKNAGVRLESAFRF